MLNGLLPEKFNEDELLLRAVRMSPDYWRNDKLSSAAFKDAHGLSVERTHTRTVQECITHIRSYLKGSIVSLSLEDCASVKAIVRYKPTTNIYHCEIHGSHDRVVLDTPQAFELANRAKIVFDIRVTTT